MRYMGSKRRLWKHISPIILKDRKPNQFYIEPFCGGCNSLCQVSGRRIAGDINPYLIGMLKSLLNGDNQIYPISKALYDEVSKDYRKGITSRYNEADMGWVGFMASYNGRFFDGGYSVNGVKSKDGGERNYINESISDLFRQLDTLQGVKFYCCEYYDLPIPKGSIIYCDPPYKDTKQYSDIRFDYDKFYQWCKEIAKQGNRVFISEYWMPSDFQEVWSMDVRCNINIEKNLRTEKLFQIGCGI